MRILVGLLIVVASGQVPAPAQHVYWSEEPTDRIQRADLDGANAVEIVSSAVSENPGALAVDGDEGKLYWTAFRFAPPFVPRIMRSNLDGSAVEQLISAPSKARPGGVGLDLAGGKVYYTDPSDCDFCGSVLRSNLDGTGNEFVLPSIDAPAGLAVDPNGSMWWTDGTSLIYRANLDGTGNQPIVSAASYAVAVDPAGGKIYWTDWALQRIRRANLDGSSVENLVSGGLDFPYGIAVDPAAGKVYWSDTNAGRIQRADLDGSEVETLISNLSMPTGIAVTGVGPDPGAVEQLVLGRTPDDLLILSWAPGCPTGDRYAVHRGSLAAGYGSLAPEPGFCDVGVDSAVLPLGVGPADFFLVVPHRSGRAGGYGSGSEGERPAAATACWPQGSQYGCPP